MPFSIFISVSNNGGLVFICPILPQCAPRCKHYFGLFFILPENFSIDGFLYTCEKESDMRWSARTDCGFKKISARCRKLGLSSVIPPSLLQQRGISFGCSADRAERATITRSAAVSKRASVRPSVPAHRGDFFCALSSTAVPLPSKQATRVRLPLRAPIPQIP